MVIERIDPSPMNPQRWCLQLSCGHEEWVTSKSKPTRRAIRCSKCETMRGGPRC